MSSHLPGAESVCKQMAYAEYVESNWNNIFETEQKPIYNAFIMPYCADAEGASANSAIFQMKRAGYIYGDWKNRNKPYHKIACILLDIKSVMQHYAPSAEARKSLASLLAAGI